MQCSDDSRYYSIALERSSAEENRLETGIMVGQKPVRLVVALLGG